jgi:hypothetical protein
MKVFAFDENGSAVVRKKGEIAVQKTIHGQEVDNKDALKNPESLIFF